MIEASTKKKAWLRGVYSFVPLIPFFPAEFYYGKLENETAHKLPNRHSDYDDHAASAKTHLQRSASELGRAAQDTKATAESGLNAGQAYATHIKDETREYSKRLVDKAEHARDKLKEEISEVRAEADDFRAQHHLKSGHRPPERVMEGAAKPSNDGIMAQAHSWSNPEAHAKYTEAKQRVENLPQEAKELKDEAIGKWQEVKSDVLHRTSQSAEDLKNKATAETERAKGATEQAKDQLASGWDRTKGSAQSTVDDATQRAQAGADRLKGAVYDAKERLESGWNQAKREAEGVAGKAEEQAERLKHQASSTWDQAKRDAEQKADQVSDRLYADKERAKSNLYSAQDKTAATLDEAKHDMERNAGVLRSTWQELKNDVRSEVHDVAEGVENFGHEAQAQAREGSEWLSEKMGYGKSKAEHSAQRAKNDITGSIRRGEAWAEEEAANLRPTRTQTAPTDAAAGLDHHRKPPEQVVEEDRKFKL